jgi:serine/threonine-protein kinase
MIGERISHYRILSKLGAGGMGEVYLAEDTQLDRKVAIKFLTPESTADEQARRRLVREARAAAKLEHPNICAIYEVGEANGQSFIAMQYVEGETLAKLIQHKPLDLRESLSIAVQVADALSEAHSRGIVHRDIKPQNIMITARGQVKVLDFGLSKVVREQTSADTAAETESVLTDPGMIIGTVPYMSPEQVRGEALDARSDIFSLGSVLYEMVSGRHPFASESAGATFSAILTRQPAPVARYSPEAPAELQRIIGKALCKDREERYQVVKDLLIDLKALREELIFEAKLGRSTPGNLTAGGTTGVERPTINTAKESREATGELAAERSTLNGIGRHKIAVAALAVVLLALAGLGVYLLPGGKAIDSIAIIPFTNVGADPDTEYLSDGIAESLISNLSQLPNLKVMSRSSAFRYKGRDIDPQEVGRELKVQAVLTGQLVQRGDALAISLELVDSRDSRQLWGEQYNRKLSDVLAVQTEIAREISDRLRLRLNGTEQKKLTKRYTENAEAYQLYLKGRFYWNKFTEEGLKKGIDYFSRAIEKDPNYASAYAGMADCYNMLSMYLAPKEVFPRAKAAAIKALELDESLAAAHISLGAYKMFYEWDWAGADQEVRLAMELNPSYAKSIELNTDYGDSNHYYCGLLDVMGRPDEAIVEMKRALDVDPLALVLYAEMGWSYYIARQYDQSIEQALKAIELDPSLVLAHAALGNDYEQKKMYGQAISELNKAKVLSGNNPNFVAELGYGYAVSGQRSEAQKIIRELMERGSREYVDPCGIANIYVGIGERDLAFEWLERAYQDRSPGIAWLKAEPKYDPLRQDTRFADLLRRIGLTS